MNGSADQTGYQYPDHPSGSPRDEPTSERSISPVAEGFGARRASRLLALAGLIAGCGVLYAATWKSDRPKAEKASLEPARQVVPFEPAPTLVNPGPSPPSLTSDHPAITPRPNDAGPSLEPMLASDPQQIPLDQPDQARSRTARLQAMRAAPLMAYSPARAEAAPALDATTAQIGQASPFTPTTLDELRRGSDVGRALARPIGDRNFLILAGTSIPCVLQTALDSATPGYVSCIIPTDVYSDNGAVILLEKGSRVLGEYRASMRQGQRRLFVLWTRAVTPRGVAIALASPAADALGRAGFDGAVDAHFWQRFGGAMLLSVVDQTAFIATGPSNAGQAVRPPTDAATVAVENSINIPPSLRKAQGGDVSIFVAQDFDFSAVYALRSR
jgi:type IV secretion system protein VirB10